MARWMVDLGYCPILMRGDVPAKLVLGCLAICGLVAGAGCGPTVAPSFESVEPAARNAAIVEAARTGDRSSVPDLVRMLSSDDPTTRVLAIRTLERLTHETRGFDASGEEHERREAIGRWEAWLREEQARPAQGGTP